MFITMFTRASHWSYPESDDSFTMPRSFQGTFTNSRLCVTFHNKAVFTVRSFLSVPNPQAGRLPLFCCPRLLIQYICTGISGRLLQQQPEDAPYRTGAWHVLYRG